MKTACYMTTIICGVLGFAFPLLWVLAVITLIIGSISSYPGRRLDGRKRTGGILGPLWDDYQDDKYRKEK